MSTWVCLVPLLEKMAFFLLGASVAMLPLAFMLFFLINNIIWLIFVIF